MRIAKIVLYLEGGLIMNILVETSARHVHVTEADLETLFGKGYQLTVKKDVYKRQALKTKDSNFDGLLLG